MEFPGYHPISEAKPLLRAILKRGGSAILTVRDEYRLLMHIPANDLPPIRFPGPLHILQPHGCSLQIYHLLHESGPIPIPMRGDLIRERYYSRRSQHATAIQHFLEGAKPDDFVHIDFGVSN
jgi:hypothetical protein